MFCLKSVLNCIIKRANFEFPNRSYTNQAVQKMARDFKFWIKKVVTAKLICAFVFANADCWFSHEAAAQLCYRLA